jgi:hypothetical protein
VFGPRWDEDERPFVYFLHFVANLHHAAAPDDNVDLLAVPMGMEGLQAAGWAMDPSDCEFLGAKLATAEQKVGRLTAALVDGGGFKSLDVQV